MEMKMSSYKSPEGHLILSPGGHCWGHYGDVKWPSWCLEIPVNRVFVQHFVWTDSKETSKVRVRSVLLSLCEGNPPVTGGFPTLRDSNAEMFPFDDVIILGLRLILVKSLTGEFPAQRASNAENVTIWWRHHVTSQPLLLTHPSKWALFANAQ